MDDLISYYAEQEFERRMTVEGMAMMNTAGLSYEDRKKQAIEYAKAKAAHAESQRMLDAAMRGDIAMKAEG